MEKSAKTDSHKLALEPRKKAISVNTLHFNKYVLFIYPSVTFNSLSRNPFLNLFFYLFEKYVSSFLLKYIPWFESEFNSFPSLLRLLHQWSHLLFISSFISIPTLKGCLAFLSKSKSNLKFFMILPRPPSIFSYQQRFSSIIASNSYIFQTLENWHIY